MVYIVAAEENARPGLKTLQSISGEAWNWSVLSCRKEAVAFTWSHRGKNKGAAKEGNIHA